METSFFGRLPGYALFRGFTQRLAAEVIRTCGSRRSPKIEDALVPAFIVEELDDGRFTVFARQYQHRSPELSTFSNANAYISSTFRSPRLSNPSCGAEQGRKSSWQQ